jgi:hypothetical protein
MKTVELVGGLLDGATIRVPSDVAAVPLVEQASTAVERWYVERPGDPFKFDLQRTGDGCELA